MKRTKSHVHYLLLIFFFTIGCSVYPNDSKSILKQPKPDSGPVIFAPGLISTETGHEFGSVFSKNGDAFYYAVDVDGKSEIRFAEFHSAEWSTPETIISHEFYSFNDPFLSPDEERLYYISDRPLDGKGVKKDIDIWYSEWIAQNGRWSEPINAGPIINSSKDEYYMSFTEEGTMYFSSNIQAGQENPQNFDIYRSEMKNEEFQKPEKLPPSINTPRYEADVFVAPDESYLIFCSVRKEGFGQGDMYISYRDGEENWSEAANLGPTINTEFHELCPFVTRDGKYFFYTSNGDIYWLNTCHITSHYGQGIQRK